MTLYLLAPQYAVGTGIGRKGLKGSPDPENYRGCVLNVLHAGLYSSIGASFQILRLVEAGKLIPLLSTALVFEYEEVLLRNQLMLKLSNRAVEDVLNELCKKGECRKIHFLWRPQLSNPKDDHILELAVAAGRADIITHNVKDISKATPFGIRILTPAQILGELK